MNIKELKEQMQNIKDKSQNEFIEKLLDMVEHYAEKTNKKDYTPTNHERETFRKILIMINNINNYL